MKYSIFATLNLAALLVAGPRAAALLDAVLESVLGEKVPTLQPGDIRTGTHMFARYVVVRTDELGFWSVQVILPQETIALLYELTRGEAIITKVYFPRLLLPFAAIGSFLLDFLVAMAVLVILMVYFGAMPTIAVIWLPFFTLFALVTALGVGTWLAAINVRYRDVKYVVPFLTQTWMFASPVIYASTLIPKQWQWLYALNPMTGVIEGFRWALIGGSRPDELIFVSAIASVLVFATSLVYFRHTEQTFADVI